MLKLLYLEECTWEFDFIINDILCNIEKEIEFFNCNNLDLLLNRKDIIENNILVISTFCNFDKVINLVKNIKPIIVFYLSDEHGNNKNINILENYTKVLFRQYNHNNYCYSNNNFQMPLGYSKYFLHNKKILDIQPKKMNQRKINCSFIGTMKSDRQHMTNVFKQNMINTNFIFTNNNWDINNLHVTPDKCFEIYNDSIFVVSGRGNTSLDCFRIYEAIVAGSIPVIVGTNDEIKNTFNYNNKIPPFIYDDTWEKVVIKCNNLLNNNEILQKIQNNLLTWFNNEVSIINKLIIKEVKKII
jgi:hypothetical protein